jgi:uncharacterized protein YqeY
MGLTDRINEGIKDAMRSREKEKLEALRAVKAALLLEMSKGSDKDISEKVEMQILTRLHKQRKESAAIFKEQGRDDLADAEEFQAGILEEFLPKQLSTEEIESIVDEIIASTGASGMKDMGKVMGQASGKMAGKADGKFIADIVKARLSA